MASPYKLEPSRLIGFTILGPLQENKRTIHDTYILTGLSFSVNSSASNKNAPFFPSNSAESNSDTSDNELDFSFEGTPSLIPMQSRTTQGSMGTTYGLQTTGSVSRTQQPMAEFDWTSSADLK